MDSNLIQAATSHVAPGGEIERSVRTDAGKVGYGNPTTYNSTKDYVQSTDQPKDFVAHALMVEFPLAHLPTTHPSIVSSSILGVKTVIQPENQGHDLRDMQMSFRGKMEFRGHHGRDPALNQNREVAGDKSKCEHRAYQVLGGGPRFYLRRSNPHEVGCRDR